MPLHILTHYVAASDAAWFAFACTCIGFGGGLLCIRNVPEEPNDKNSDDDNPFKL